MSIRLFAINTAARCITSSLKREASCTFPCLRTQFSVTRTFCQTAALHSLDKAHRTHTTLFCNASKPTTHSFSTHIEGGGDDDIELPPLPTDCCMSGCANCVWVLYAEELALIYKDGGRAADRVLEAIEDPSLKIFLSLELREKFKN